VSDPKVILVTGVAGYWGARVARRLLAEPDIQVIGLDVREPQTFMEGLEFVPADLNSSLLAEFFQVARVDTVCHLKFTETLQDSEAAYTANVAAAKALLTACVQAGVRKAVLKSSTTVYGANPSNSAFLPESYSFRGSQRYAYNRHLVEVEQFCQALQKRASDLLLTILRFASIIGPTADTPMTRFLKGRWTPILLGFDPMFQVIHEDDVVEALAFAALSDVPGAFNVAAEGVLPLTRILGLSRTAPLPLFHPLVYWGVSRMKELADYLPIEADYLRYRWVADLARMREEMGFYPQHPAEAAIRAFRDGQRPDQREPDGQGADESRLRQVIEAWRKSE
jgi:UDP-glucose 4-epimerase